MTTSKTKPTVNNTATTPRKPPKKLIPRVAPKTAAPPPASPAQAAPANAPKAAAKAAPKAKPLPPEVAATQAELAKALEAAKAIKINRPLGKPDKPKASEIPVKPEKTAKPKKQKRIRDSFSMPESEFAQLGALKKRVAGIKKSELLRAGILLLCGLSDAELAATLAKVPRIKTGRPRKA